MHRLFHIYRMRQAVIQQYHGRHPDNRLLYSKYKLVKNE